MKTHSSRRSRGFTLIELLVVITIIAILASLGTGAGLRAIQKAKSVTALNTATSVQTAVNQFYSEYSSMPVASLAADATISSNSTSGVNLVNELLGTAGSTLNTRRIKFLSTGEGKNSKDGIIYSATGAATGLFDPWGGPYWIILDGDFDEILTGARTTSSASTALNLNGRRAAVFSDGPDHASGAGGRIVDDVKTWK